MGGWVLTALFSLWYSLYCWENFLHRQWTRPQRASNPHPRSRASLGVRSKGLPRYTRMENVDRTVEFTHSSRFCQLVLWRSSILLTVSRRLRSRLDSAA